MNKRKSCEINEDIQCAICTDNITATDLPKSCFLECCKNRFHPTCLQKWLMLKQTCPLCRKNVKMCSNHSNLVDHDKETLAEMVSFISKENTDINKQILVLSDELLSTRMMLLESLQPPPHSSFQSFIEMLAGRQEPTPPTSTYPIFNRNSRFT